MCWGHNQNNSNCCCKPCCNKPNMNQNCCCCCQKKPEMVCLKCVCEEMPMQHNNMNSCCSNSFMNC